MLLISKCCGDSYGAIASRLAPTGDLYSKKNLCGSQPAGDYCQPGFKSDSITIL
ncbi:hypothetical protein SAMN05216496_3036 [Pseudomonas sp. Z003-0.4C(8344-21)]|nr:hypothetical protein SAMN05216496_3036 [Pseudomonas sp. Z003-0.4C(8344-21)]